VRHEHKTHAYGHLEQIGEKHRGIVTTLLGQTRTHLEVLKNSINIIESREAEVNLRRAELEAKIELVVQEIMVSAKERRNVLMSELKSIYADKLAALEAQKKSVETLLKESEPSTKFADEVLCNGQTVDLLNLKSVLMARLSDIKSRQAQFEPLEMADMDLTIDMSVVLKSIGECGRMCKKLFEVPPKDMERPPLKEEAQEPWIVQRFQCVPVLDTRNNQGNVCSLCASPKGDVVAVGREISADQWWVVQLWDARKGHLLIAMGGHTKRITGLSFSDDGKRLVSSSDDKTVRVWDMKSGQTVKVLNEHTGPVYAVSISGNGKICAYGGMDKSVRVWDVDSGKVIRVLNGHSACVNDVVMSHDGNVVVSGSYDLSVRVWDVATGVARQVLQDHTDSVIGVDMSHDGKEIVSMVGDGTMRIWNALTGQRIRQIKGSAMLHGVSMSLDGNMVAARDTDRGKVCIWEVESGRMFAEVQVEGGIFRSHVSFAGKVIAAINRKDQLQIWRVVL